MMSEIINHLWQSTLFAIVAALATFAFRGNRAHVRYWIWFSASVKFLLPLSLLITLGSYSPWTPGRIGDVPATPLPLSYTLAQVTQPFPQAAPLPPGIDWTPLVISLWLCGFTTIVLLRLRGWLGVRSAIRFSRPLDLPCAVEVRSSPGLLEPGVVGFFRPVLLVPEGIVERLSPAQLTAVLAHEVCHVRRRDNVLACIHMITEAVFWFHPLVWWIGARLLNERERACDEEVLRLGNPPQIYAEGILNICKLYVESPLACVSGVTGSDLQKRIEAIMENRTLHELNLMKKTALAIAAFATLGLPLAIGVLNAPLSRAQSTATSRPRFQSASVSPCTDELNVKKGRGYSSEPGNLSTGCMPLIDGSSLGLFQRAYVRFAGGQPHWPGVIPIVGGPEWVRSEFYVINATGPANATPEMMEGPMMQAFLEDRFRLKIHREAREVPVYALTVAGSGPRLQPFVEGSCMKMPLTVTKRSPEPGQKYCKALVSIDRPAVDAQGATLTEFSQLLSLVLDRPVIDQTGMQGKFDIRLEFAIDEATPRFLPGGDLAQFANANANAGLQSVFAAIQQFGLKLEATKGPREFLVIDHIEKPSAN
jgi:uncharacterized protein (TIGR03435 family)